MTPNLRASTPARRVWRALRDPRTVLLLLAALVLLPVFVWPTVEQEKRVFEYLFVVDISQSMNVRDYLGEGGGEGGGELGAGDDNAAVAGRPVTRLDYVKQALARAVRDLPCGSRVGLGLFTGWQSTVLFEPIEVCRHYAEISTVIAQMDWRMTWAPQSNILRGLYDALNRLERVEQPPTLVFITDGDEAPPVSERRRPDLPIKSGEVAGLIIGAGDVRPSPIPKLDMGGEMTGYFQHAGENALSALAEDYLQELAEGAGLDYQRLDSAAGFSALLRQPRFATPLRVEQGIGWVFALVALLLLAVFYLVLPFVPRLNRVAARRPAGERIARRAVAPDPASGLSPR